MKKNKPTVSTIKTVQNILEVRSQVHQLPGKVLVVFDFDNVLVWLGPEVEIGTDPWFDKHLKDKHTEFGDLTAAEIATLDIFIEAHTANAPQAVEAETAEFINELQRDQRCVIGLTSRSGKYLSQLTRAQANALNFCFSKSEKFKGRTVDLTHLGPHCHVEDGYFYTGGRDKGLILTAGLELLGIEITDYDWVVFIDDDIKRVQQVQDKLKNVTNFLGFRYAVLDKHLTNLRAIFAGDIPTKASL